MKKPDTQQIAQAAATEPAAADPHAGQGGSYVVDPATGKRELAHRTAAADAAPVIPDTPPLQE